MGTHRNFYNYNGAMPELRAVHPLSLEHIAAMRAYPHTGMFAPQTGMIAYPEIKLRDSAVMRYSRSPFQNAAPLEQWDILRPGRQNYSRRYYSDCVTPASADRLMRIMFECYWPERVVTHTGLVKAGTENTLAHDTAR